MNKIMIILILFTIMSCSPLKDDTISSIIKTDVVKDVGMFTIDIGGMIQDKPLFLNISVGDTLEYKLTKYVRHTSFKILKINGSAVIGINGEPEE